MTTKFVLGQALNGFNSFALLPTDTMYSGLLFQAIAQSLTLPLDSAMYRVVFAFEVGTDVWVSYTETAIIPGGGIAQTNSELNPTVRDLPKATTISFITSAASAEFGVLIYALQ